MTPEKLNMSKSFYKYIAKDLIIEWFKNNRPSNGSRYYMVIEDKLRRNAILEALQEYSEELTVNGIYEGLTSQKRDMTLML